MNIFVLDENAAKAAQYHCDKHTVKMSVEYAQILSTVVRKKFHNEPICAAIYKPTHVNHPCVKWAGESFGNFSWLAVLAKFTLLEYTLRYGKRHKSHDVVDRIIDSPAGCYHYWQSQELTPFVVCTDDNCKNEPTVVDCYRKFYNTAKRHFLSWKEPAKKPEWVK